MSVYTKVTTDELKAFLLRYSLGNLVSHAGIEAGVTNTNYWLETDTGAFVLTLYEHFDADSLHYALSLQHHLASNGVSCAAPVVDNQGLLFSQLNDRPAAIVCRVPGSVCRKPSADQCALIGAELARFHLAGRDFKLRRLNNRGLDWCLTTLEQLRFVLSDADLRLANSVIQSCQTSKLIDLPLGALHGDLFHDNALFDGDGLGGIVDFDYACHDYFVYDIAVTVNDWCIDADGVLEADKLQALLTAYGDNRPLLDCEHAALPLMLQLAALRFWLSRLYDKSFPREGELTFVKDPDEFRQMLLQRRAQPSLLAYAKAGKNGAE
jgi:homoserine kinase type II